MKKLCFLLLLNLFLIASTTNSQTIQNKNYFAVSGGSEGYKGDLGSVWFKLDEEWYGFAGINYSRYINKSIDMAGAFTFGDYGHCREADEPVLRSDGTEILNMLGRLSSLRISSNYKFANGYLLKEQARFAPYVFAGVGINHLSEYWWHNKTRANTGYFGSLNAGLGVRYNFNSKFSLTYSLGFAYFSTDKLDKRIAGTNDMLMQYALQLGFNF